MNLMQLRATCQSIYIDVSTLTKRPHGSKVNNSEAIERIKCEIRNVAKLIDAVGAAKLATWPDKFYLGKAFGGQMRRDELAMKVPSLGVSMAGSSSTVEVESQPSMNHLAPEASAAKAAGPSDGRARAQGGCMMTDMSSERPHH